MQFFGQQNIRFAAALLVLFATSVIEASANETIDGSQNESAEAALSEAVSGQSQPEVQSVDRILQFPSQLSERIRSIHQLPNANIQPEASGSGGHPYTTQRAGAENSISAVDLFPWNATGKLFMKFGAGVSVCTASVIGKNLLVTAAHCVHNFGQGQAGFAKALVFQPARHLQEMPFDTWNAQRWWIPKAYFDGTDKCLPQAPGIVCENDVAVVVLKPNNGQNITDLTGKYLIKELNDDMADEFGYVSFLGQSSAQITQLGYPSRDYDGVQMIRSDSLGFKDEPSNVVIGSAQTGGSSGGPWLQNFGSATSFTGSPGSDDDPNVVSAVTSWGYTSDVVKIQGASRFAKNSIFTQKTNIKALVDSACQAVPSAC